MMTPYYCQAEPAGPRAARQPRQPRYEVDVNVRRTADGELPEGNGWLMRGWCMAGWTARRGLAATPGVLTGSLGQNVRPAFDICVLHDRTPRYRRPRVRSTAEQWSGGADCRAMSWTRVHVEPDGCRCLVDCPRR